MTFDVVRYEGDGSEWTLARVTVRGGLSETAARFLVDLLGADTHAAIPVIVSK